MDAQVLYCIGFILVVLFLLMGIDDFVWDIFSLFRRRSYKRNLLDLYKLETQAPKLLALAIAAWHEDNVLGDVIDNIIESTHYPKSMYHIFLGVYPNDDATVAVAMELEKKYSNVHVVINELPGPTSKAQNINYVIRQMKEFEKEHGWRFASLTIHDSEDVVHPYELKVTNYLLEEHEAMQFPVFPIMQMPKLSNYFKTITTGTYADEFAENHFTTMVSRYSSGAFVPSAGTGFALSRKTLDSFGDEDVLPRDSLTEDYRLSLTLFEKGIQMYYVLERVPRINNNNKVTLDFIATRSLFPNTFKAAVKQKTRWILGITMQSFKFRDIFKTKGLRLVGRYSLYKDLKAKVGNLLAMVGYPVLIYFIVSLFIPLTPIYPAYSLSWYMSLVVTCMMIERQTFRAVAINKVYGMRSVIFACLLPPLMPLRLVWGNIINLVATLKAYMQFFLGNQTPEKKEERQRRKAEAAKKAGAKKTEEKKPELRKLSWAKTDHQFLDKKILKRYHRNLGDILLEKGYVTTDELASALTNATKKKQPIGAYLLSEEIITEEQMLNALSNVKQIQYLSPDDLDEYSVMQNADFFEEEELRKLFCLPLLKTKTGFVIAFCDDSQNDAQTVLRNKYDITVNAVFASAATVRNGLDAMYGSSEAAPETGGLAMDMFIDDRINYEQLVLSRTYKHKLKISDEEILKKVGLMV